MEHHGTLDIEAEALNQFNGALAGGLLFNYYKYYIVEYILYTTRHVYTTSTTRNDTK